MANPSVAEFVEFAFHPNPDWSLRLPKAARANLEIDIWSPLDDSKRIARLAFKPRRQDVGYAFDSVHIQEPQAWREVSGPAGHRVRLGARIPLVNFLSEVAPNGSSPPTLEGKVPLPTLYECLVPFSGSYIAIQSDFAKAIAFALLHPKGWIPDEYLRAILVSVKLSGWQKDFHRAVIDAIEDPAVMAHVPTFDRERLVKMVSDNFADMLYTAFPAPVQLKPLSQPFYAEREDQSQNALAFLEEHYGGIEDRPPSNALRNYDLPLYNALTLVVSRNRKRGKKPDSLDDILRTRDTSITTENAVAAVMRKRERSRKYYQEQKRKRRGLKPR